MSISFSASRVGIPLLCMLVVAAACEPRSFDKASDRARRGAADSIDAFEAERGLAATQRVGMPVIEMAADGTVGQRYFVLPPPAQARSASAEQIETLAAGLVDEYGGELLHVYTEALDGFAAILPDSAVADLRTEQFLVVPDKWATVAATQLNPPSWGLDRLDQKEPPLNASYTYSEDGTDVDVYVLDSGVNTSHNEFGTRGKLFWDAFRGSGRDTFGHGTHVAATVGGKDFGVAKNVRIFNVRTVNRAGGAKWTDVIASIDAVISRRTPSSVINLSVVGDTSALIDQAVRRAVAAGITVVVAAGNSGKDACDYSPAREPVAITVGATDAEDERWVGERHSSNVGKCLDIFAPGDNIMSATHKNNHGGVRQSGTSMATPHVTGAVARYLQAHPGAAPNEVARWLVDRSIKGAIRGLDQTTPNRLLYLGP